MFFLIRMVFWLAVVLAWLPSGGAKPGAAAPSVKNLTVVVTDASGAIAWEGRTNAARLITPEDYPSSVRELISMILFALGFAQLFTLFAPFAWLIRLLGSEKLAATLTILFGVVLIFVKSHSSHVLLPPDHLLKLVLLTVASGLLSIHFLLRGGVFLTWWFALLLFSRHILHLVSR